ncbi:hypothetical protein MPSEU_001060000 [Mayamaea pseudoterrestris]|nr:hypothetical protein MPSEU_001060000 [Mayamaea pseudoterrestris]
MSAPSSNWKHPSAQQKQKYGLVDLPDDFEPTAEETVLLDMYKTVQTYERHAAKLKEEAARARLAAAEEEFNKRMKPKKTMRAPSEMKQKSDGVHSSAEQDEYGNEIPAFRDDDRMEEVDQTTMRERREAKLEALRIEVEEAKQQKQSDEDALRQQLLQEQEPILDGPVMKRKRIDETNDQATKSLIANITAASTPPHEFSKALNLSVTQGRLLFPTSSEQDQRWSPPASAIGPNDGALKIRLAGFDISKAQVGQGNNTIVIKFMAPAQSKRFSMNITTPEYEDNLDSVLFHFNPRHFERGGQVVLNNKLDGNWEQHIALPLSQLPLLFGEASCTLVIQITGDGFDVFMRAADYTAVSDGLVHIARWEHRKELPASDLVLQFPSTDDYGNIENWILYKVWWGHQDVRAKPDAQVPGVNAYDADHPRKLFVSNLAKLFTEADMDVRKAELERAFRKYGGDRGVSVIAPMNATYAFIEMENERQADIALTEMATQYKLKRARRSRHEALQEKRAAAAAGGITTGAGTTWD